MAYIEKCTFPAPHFGFVEKVILEERFSKASFFKLGLRIENTPPAASSDVRSHGTSPAELHSGNRSTFPCSNPLKYVAPSGISVGAAVDGDAETEELDALLLGVNVPLSKSEIDGAELALGDCEMLG